MPTYEVIVRFSSEIEGEITVRVENEEPLEKAAILDMARDQAEAEIEDRLRDGSSHDLEIDSSTSTIKSAHMKPCRDCRGRTYKVEVIDPGAGLIKAGPCPSCQRIPSTALVCEHILEVLNNERQ